MFKIGFIFGLAFIATLLIIHVYNLLIPVSLFLILFLLAFSVVTIFAFIGTVYAQTFQSIFMFIALFLGIGYAGIIWNKILGPSYKIGKYIPLKKYQIYIPVFFKKHWLLLFVSTAIGTALILIKPPSDVNVQIVLLMSWIILSFPLSVSMILIAQHPGKYRNRKNALNRKGR